MKASSFVALGLRALALSSVSALFEEEAGLFDFTVATAGHGVGTQYLYATDNAVLTGSPDSCMLASRSIATGNLQWRRNVCVTSENSSPSVDTTALDPFFFTVGSSGVVRSWTWNEGALVWETPPPTTRTADAVQSHRPQLWAVSTESHKIVASTAQEDGVLVLYNAVQGSALADPIVARNVIKEGNNLNAKWLHVFSDDTQPDVIRALVGLTTTKENGLVASASYVVTLKLTEDGVTVSDGTKLSHNDFVVDSMQVQRVGDHWRVMALAPKGNKVVQLSIDSSGTSHVIDLAQWHPSWTSMEAITSMAQSGMLRIRGQDNRYPVPKNTMALFRFDEADGKSWDQWYAIDGEEETSFDGIAHCQASDLVVALQSNSVLAFHVASIDSESGAGRLTRVERHRRFSPLHPLVVTGDAVVLSEEDAVTDFVVLTCTGDSLTALLTTAQGTTLQLTVSKLSSEAAESKIIWTQEEGLAQVSSALLLDASHASAVLDAISDEEHAETLKSLTVSSRLQSQWEDTLSFFTKASPIEKSRDHDFGFVKVAVLLSQTAHRLWGMPTSGDKRGSLSWTLNLPRAAERHILVHGTTSSTSVVHGINGGSHSQEVLVLSSVPSGDGSVEIVWTCVDGTNGAVHGSGSSLAASPVVQVVPLFGSGETCRQMALLLHEDHTVSLIPADEKTHGTAVHHIQANRNGMYTHLLDREHAAIDTFEILQDGASFATRPVGHTVFPDETIVGVTYPQRDEVIQSPCSVLGDNSLLLKYLNPHMAVVVTMSKDGGKVKKDAIASALGSKSGVGKRKPVGVTQTGGEAVSTDSSALAADEEPNLFVNVVDTVSGRVLYRASHSNAAADQHVPVLITENWVIYAFFNDKIRRTELGVLTMYEGMIDKKGLTAFSSPEQALSFSSLEARDTKPVVLTKTYGVSKTVTAIGVTSTRGGISSRHILLATGDDRIMSITRLMLEPRRPTGDVKETEKEEGLFKYSPLLPLISLWSPSYNQTVHSTKTILSTSAALESQSLILAFGGSDIFFSRLSPSKGFDLLPDSFNRVLLTIVLIVLLGMVGVVMRMSSKKLIKMAWA